MRRIGPAKYSMQIVEVGGHVDQRAAAAFPRVLPPRALDFRIPARQLGPQIDDLAEPALVDELLDLDVRPVELHHVAFLEEHAAPAADGHGLLGPARRLSVSGFSQRTCLPASAASSICRAWQATGEAM